MNVNCGIYKITSPTKRIYIGQSINISRRFNQYKRIDNSTKKIVRLYNSLNKYGPDKHSFEILEFCERLDLNIKERYWQDFYDSVGINGLNCTLTNTSDSPKILSEETKQKISLNNARYWKNKKLSKESIEKRKANRIYTAEYRAKIGAKSKGRKQSLKSIALRRQKLLGRTHSAESKLKMSLKQLGKKRSPKTLEKMRIASRGRTLSLESRKKISQNSKSAKVLGISVNMYCFHTKKFLKSFSSITEAAIYLDRPATCISNILAERSKSTTVKQTKQKVIFTLK
jgi:group I intron endonuclease